MELLVVFRVLQGAAGALLVPGSLSLISAAFSGEEEGRAIGTWSAASAATTLLGPFVGGLLVDTISWRVAFLINVPLALVALYAVDRHVRRAKTRMPPDTSTGWAPQWWPWGWAASRTALSQDSSANGETPWPTCRSQSGSLP